MPSDDLTSFLALRGLAIIQVKPGTQILNEDTGEMATVTDCEAVCKKGMIYVTPKVYDAFKREISNAE